MREESKDIKNIFLFSTSVEILPFGTSPEISEEVDTDLLGCSISYKFTLY